VNDVCYIVVSLLVTQHLAAYINRFSGGNDRDIFNEKPSKEELISATQVS